MKTPTGAVHPCTLTENELRWVVHFLDEAGDQLGRMSCNDFEIEDTPQNREMLFNVEQWNSGGSDWEGFTLTHGELDCPNFTIPHYLAERLRGWVPPLHKWEAECERMRLAKIAELEEQLARLKESG